MKNKSAVNRQEKYQRISDRCDEFAKKIQAIKSSQDQFIKDLKVATDALDKLHREIIDESTLKPAYERIEKSLQTYLVSIEDIPKEIIRLAIHFKNNLWEL